MLVKIKRTLATLHICSNYHKHQDKKKNSRLLTPSPHPSFRTRRHRHAISARVIGCRLRPLAIARVVSHKAGLRQLLRLAVRLRSWKRPEISEPGNAAQLVTTILGYLNTNLHIEEVLSLVIIFPFPMAIVCVIGEIRRYKLGKCHIDATFTATLPPCPFDKNRKIAQTIR